MYWIFNCHIDIHNISEFLPTSEMMNSHPSMWLTVCAVKNEHTHTHRVFQVVISKQYTVTNKEM